MKSFKKNKKFLFGMVYLEQMYTRLLKHVDNHCLQYYNKLTLQARTKYLRKTLVFM